MPRLYSGIIRYYHDARAGRRELMQNGQYQGLISMCIHAAAKNAIEQPELTYPGSIERGISGRVNTGAQCCKGLHLTTTRARVRAGK